MADLLTGTILTLDPTVNQMRLTLETGVAVSTTDQTGKSTVYLTPYVGNRLALYDGTASWKLYALAADVSLPLGTLTNAKNYDVFAFDSSGTVTLELSAAWASDTARTDALALQDGVLVKSGSTTRRYLGTFRTTTTTTTADSGGYTGTTNVGAQRYLWNYYNRVWRPMYVTDLTDSWSYTTGTWRQANGAAGNKIEYVTGVADALLRAQIICTVFLASNSARPARVAVGVDSTTTPSGVRIEGYHSAATGDNVALVASYTGHPGLGYHALNWLEFGGDGTCAFAGDGGSTTGPLSGMRGELFA